MPFLKELFQYGDYVLEEETRLLPMAARFATHYKNKNGAKFYGHYNMNIVEALRDLATRIEEDH